MTKKQMKKAKKEAQVKSKAYAKECSWKEDLTKDYPPMSRTEALALLDASIDSTEEQRAHEIWKHNFLTEIHNLHKGAKHE